MAKKSSLSEFGAQPFPWDQRLSAILILNDKIMFDSNECNAMAEELGIYACDVPKAQTFKE